MISRGEENLIPEAAPAFPAGVHQYFVPGVSPLMRLLERSVADIAPTEIPVLFVGESGTGKEVAALQRLGVKELRGKYAEVFGSGGSWSWLRQR